MRRQGVLAALVAAGALSGCNPKLTGAPCASDDNCPKSQYCTANGTCDWRGTTGGDAGTACRDAAGNPADLQTDASNCGECGRVCPVPVNAQAACRKGECGRGRCKAGYFDIDGAATFGCESTCVGRVCTDPAGNKVTVNNVPIPEAGGAYQSLASGSSFGSRVQTNAAHTNVGILGESTPPGVKGAVESKNASHKHYGGFTALRR